MRPRSSTSLGRTLVAALLALVAACSSGTEVPTLDQVRAALDAGRLDRASALIAQVPTTEGDIARQRLARQVEEALEQRDEHRARFEEILASVPAENQRRVLDALRELKGRVAEPAFRGRIEDKMAMLPEIYRDAKAALAQGRAPGASLSGDEPIEEAAPDDGGYPRTGGADVARADAPRSTPGRSSSEPDDGPYRAERAERLTRTALAPTIPDDDPGVLRDAARLAHREGRLADARELYLAASTRTKLKSMRQDDLVEAAALEDRLLLREELAETFRRAPAEFPGVDALEAAGVVRDGSTTPWRELGTQDWLALAAPANLSARAELGLVRERLVANDASGAFFALHELHEAGRVLDADVTSVVARFRGEPAPREGYVWSKDRFVSRDEQRAAAEARQVAALLKEFTNAKVGKIQADLWEDLERLAGEGELIVALQTRHERVADRLERDKSLARLLRVEEARRALDVARETALELIFDEQEYFYPYRPPECPPEKAKEYPAVQRRVDELVNLVRDAWREDVTAKIEGRTLALVEEFAWLHEELGLLDVEVEWPAKVPTSLLQQDRSLEVIDLETFAWTRAEAEELALSRKVRELNRLAWSEGVDGGDEDLLSASLAEQRQVQITNDYRLMFGRRALAWNPRLQRAAQDHSTYMSTTGDFGHFEKNPETRSPVDRMTRRGYDRGVSENCHMGGGDPMGAHVGWRGSSGHHRNLLMPRHREMASALSGPYWTQNFGSGTGFLDRLK